MAHWPAGHRIEDYQFKIYDASFAWIGDLATVHGAAGSRTLYGQFGGKCTFELSLDDPWAAVLSAEAQHFLKVLRDGVQIFAGLQVKLEREDEPAKESGFVKFQFLPLAFLAKWRHCLPIAPATTLATTGTKPDDAFKWIVERVLGSTAPNTPTSGLGRAIANFSVAADKGEYASNVGLDPTNQNLYEFLQRWGANFDIDWDIYLDSSDHPEFQTWYPRRGLDRSEGNGSNTEAIFTDAMGDVAKVSYGMDTGDAVTVVLSADGSKDEAAAEAVRTAWLIRETAIRSNDSTTMQVALEDKRPRIWCKLEEYQEMAELQWQEGAASGDASFSVGDTITWASLRIGYSDSAIICQIDWEIDKDGFEHLALTFGDPEPDIMDKMRGGGKGSLDPDYSDPGAAGRVLGITGTDTNTVYPASGTNCWTFAAGTGIASITAATANTVTFNTVWQRGTGPGETALYPATAGDALAISNDLYVFSDSIGGTQTAGFDSESGGVHAVGWVQVGDSALGTPSAGIELTHNVTHPDIAIVNGANTMVALRSATGNVDIFQGGSLDIHSDGSTSVFTVAGATGNTTWAAGATWTIEGDEYTLPTDYPGTTGMALVCTDAGVMSWEAPTAATHALLGPIHSDAATAEMSTGDLIVGTESGWDELVIGPNGAILTSNGTMAVWQNEVHRGSLLYGIEGPTWSELTVGAANKVLQSDGTDISWQTLAAADLSDGVPNSRTITAGSGLTGGGDLSDNRTLAVGAGTGITVNADDVAITNTGVGADTYADATHVAQITVNAQGQITAASDVEITGVTPAAHDLLSAHSYTGGAALDVFGLSAANTLAKLTPSSNPGAASAILKSDAAGKLELQGLTLNGDLKLVSGADLLVYSDDGSTLVASIDGATGVVTTYGGMVSHGGDIEVYDS